MLNLLDLEPTSVSRDIKDYDLLICGDSGIGKSEYVLDLYGKDRSLALAFEDSYSGISGAYVANIQDYASLMNYMIQLENPQVKEKYDTVIIDTLFMLDHIIEKSITDSYGVELLGDALKYNKAYKIVDKRFLSIIKRLKKAGYTLVYVAHPMAKKIKIGGVEITRYEPKVSDRVKDLLLPEVDIQLFCYFDADGTRKVATQQSQYWNARCRVAELSPLMDFDPELFKTEFAKGIETKQANGGIIVEKRPVTVEDERTFEQAMEYLTKDLAVKCSEANKMEEANRIIVANLGRDNDGNIRTLANATPEMIGALETIIVELEMLLQN